MAGIWVISGMQGAGKSTVSAALARRFVRAAHVSGDVLQHMIVAGAVWPSVESTDANGVVRGEAAVQLRLRLSHGCALARSFAAAGISAVLDDIVIGSRLGQLREELRGARFGFVMLTPRLEVVRAREAGRGTALHELWSWMDDEIRSRTERCGLWLDSSDQRVDETVDEIMRREHEAVVTG